MSTSDLGRKSELDAWKEVHATLINAVKVAKRAVDAQKAQRRFWLEEICTNLNEAGKLTPISVWKRTDTTLTTTKTTGGGGGQQSSSTATTASAKHTKGLHPKSQTATKRKRKDTPGKSDTKPSTKSKPRKQDGSGELPSSAPTSTAAGAPSPPKKKPKIKISRLSQAEAVIHDTTMAAGRQQQHPPPSATAVPPHHRDFLRPPPGSYPGVPDFGNPASQWGVSAAQANNLQMMAAVAFGANPAGAYHHGHHAAHHHPSSMLLAAQQQQQAYNPYYPPPGSTSAAAAAMQRGYHPTGAGAGGAPTAPPPPQPQPSLHAVPPGVPRTYQSIQDVGQSDDESDADKF